MKRLAISTGGGDAPGLNAVIRAAVKTAIYDYNIEVLGIRNGLDGLFEEGGVYPLTISTVRGILPRGGTILGAANRGNPFKQKVEKDGEIVVVDRTQAYVEAIERLDIDGLILVGGDGTLGIGLKLLERGVPIVGVPKTIDNDVGGTDYTFGFDTAASIAMDAIDRLHSTAEAHHRVMILELMGRDAGFIALTAGLAGGADVILIPEIPFKFEYVCKKIQERVARGTYFSIISASEGARPVGEEKSYTSKGSAMTQPRLGGIGQRVADEVSEFMRGGDAGHRVGPFAARWKPDGVRSGAGDALRLRGSAAGSARRLRPHGGAARHGHYQRDDRGGGACAQASGRGR